MIFIKSLISRLPLGQLGINTIFSTLGLLTRAVLQAGYLILLSRWMGPHDYGFFSGSVAAAILLAPLSGWGIAYILSDRLSRDGSLIRSLWATALVQIFFSSIALSSVLILASVYLLGVHMGLGSILLLAMAELLALPVAQVATTAFLAKGRGGSSALLMCLVPFFRVLVVVTAFSLGMHADPTLVVVLHFAGSVIGACVAMYLLARAWGAPAWHERLHVGAMTTEGTSYAFGALLGMSYRELDKVFLLQVLGATVAGTYTAASRVAGVFVLPIMALAGAMLPKFFAATDARARARAMRAAGLTAIGYGALATGLAAITAQFMPDIFGKEYADASGYLLMMSPWILLFALHQHAAVGLTTSGRQVTRVVIESVGLVIVVAINLALLRSLGAAASIYALLFAEAFMAAACWLVLRASPLGQVAKS